MPDKSEVIMGNMDETRKDLADKLGELEKKVTQTVSSVADLVEKVPETVESVKETIQETVSTVTGSVHDTVEAVKGGMESTVESVKSFFNIPRQVDRHPWLMMGGSVLLGYLGGRLLTPRSHHAEAAAWAENGMSPAAVTGYTAPPYTPPQEAAPAYRSAPAYESARAPEPPQTSSAATSGGGWLSRLSEHFGGELKQLKGLAVGTLLGVARDMVTQWVPENLKHDVKEIVNNFTSDLGGKVMREPIMGQGQGSPQGDGR